jgi:DNA-binding LacI/PurR family transcriptional regulator
VTLRDVADYANVSTSTVSRALNNFQYVDEKTRAIIQQAVEDLNYPLDNLRSYSQASRTVALLSRGDFSDKSSSSGFSPNFEDQVSYGARLALEDSGFQLEIQRSYMTKGAAPAIIKNFTESGLILLSGLLDLEFVQALQSAGIPFVIAGSHVKPLQTNCVMADIIDGVEQAVDHLVARGRRKIGLVNTSMKTKTSMEKSKGVRLALQKHGLLCHPDHEVASTQYDLEAGYRQTLELIERDELDAIIYGHDVMAMGGLRALGERGYRVPDDVAVIGFLDYEIARFTNPPLTSVRFDMPLVGAIAARRLRMMIDEPDDQDWSVVVPTELVVREST